MIVKVTNKYKPLYEHYKSLYYDCSEKLHWYRMIFVLAILPVIVLLVACAIC